MATGSASTPTARPQPPSPSSLPVLPGGKEAELRDHWDETFDTQDPGTEIGIVSRSRRLWRLLSTPVVEVLASFALFPGHVRGGFQESKDQIVKLPEDDVKAFAVFAEWLYVGPEADTGDIFVNMHGKNIGESEEGFLSAIQSDIFVPQLSGPNDERKEAEGEGSQTEGDEDEMWETGSTLSENARHDNYDFSLQFASYVLADKLMSPEFKRHILDEIRHHAEFCDLADLIVDMIRYVYKNTVNGDAVRKICVFLKCVASPIEETLADPKFQELMEEGGSLVSDVMDVCRRHAAKENWQEHADAIELENKFYDKFYEKMGKR